MKSLLAHYQSGIRPMARPHIGFVKQKQLAWHDQSIPGSDATVHYRTLSADDEIGAFTRLASPPTDEPVEELQSPMTQELFILEGELSVGLYDLGRHEYSGYRTGRHTDRFPAPRTVGSSGPATAGSTGRPTTMAPGSGKPTRPSPLTSTPRR